MTVPTTLPSTTMPSTTMPPTSAVVTTVTAATTTAAPVTGDLAGWELVAITVGTGPELAVALAATPADRAQGLMGVSDLGDLGGMLFEWEAEVRSGFWMKNTLLALDLAFFDSGGVLVDWTSLEPCLGDPCPIYLAPSPFRWVLETPVGSLPQPALTDLLVRLA